MHQTGKNPIYLWLGLPLVIMLILRFGYNMDGLYGQDSYEYLRYAAAFRKYILTGTSPGDFFWPVNYPIAGALLSLIIPDVGLCLQLVSALSLGLTIFFAIKNIQLIFPSHYLNGMYLWIGIMFISPFMFRYGMTIMADMFTAANLTAGSFYLLSSVKNKKPLHLIPGLILFAMAFMCRYGVILLELPIILYAIFSFIKQKNKWYWYLLLLFGFVPLIPHLIIRNQDPAGFVLHPWLTNWSPINFFSFKSQTLDGTAYYTLPNLVYALLGLFHPRYFFIGILFLLIGFRKLKFNLETRLMLISVMIYLFFLAGIPYQNNRFLLLAFPMLTIILYPAIVHVLTKMKRSFNPVILSTFIIIQVIMIIFSFKIILNRNYFEREVYTYMMKKNSPSIYTMDVDVALVGRGYPSPIYNIWSNYYDKIDENAVVIFNTKTFPIQWKNKMPMKNWDHFNQEYYLKEIHSFNEDWKVYAFK